MDRLLSKGTSGQDVRALQDVLNFHIRRLEPLQADGAFGPLTEARVREFQRVNGLKVDGLVGPKTFEKLYAATELPVSLLLMPSLELPKFGQQKPKFGIQPPQLIPPLHWPGFPVPPPSPFTLGGGFKLSPNTSTPLPSLLGPPNALGFKITVPTRLDPEDPAIRSRKAILELINDLPVDSKFKAFLIDQVPNPIQKISPPSAGFKWGLSPLFNPLDPKGFGVKGNAQFMVRLTEGGNGVPNMTFGAWGDGKFFLNFETKAGEARPKVEAEGQLFLGLKGTF